MGCGSSAPVDTVNTPRAKEPAPAEVKADVTPVKEAPKTSENGLPLLLPQPTSPTGKIVLIECEGGSDKKADGHRGDTIPISNALIEKNWECIPVYYSDAKYDEVKALLEKCDGFITRINPGTYPGVTQSKVDDLLREIAAMGKAPMQHPDVMQKMGAKDALVKIANLSCGMADTYAYYDIPTFKENFPKSIATGVRVVKQNRGSQGEGIWVCKVKEGQEGEVTGSTILDLQEAVDNHKEEKTVDEFMTFCEQYIVGENGQLIDQRFLPRIVEGELRVNMIYDKPTEIVHKKPADGGISATLKSGAKYVSYKPDDPQFKKLMDDFVNKDLPQIMPSLGMEGMPIPLIWTSDFILGDKVDGEDTYFVGEFNCSCVGITQQMHLVDEVSDAVIKIVEMTRGKSSPPPLPTLLPQPTSPTGKIVLIECEGGSDKKADGHRGDTIPISNALIEKNWECIPVYYSDAKYDEVKALLEKCDGFITRINPGTYPGVTQSKVDDLLREIAAMGKAPMQHPDVMQKMGAKDALVKIANLSCGMADTYAYYDIPTFKENFPKSIATGVRVVKQNRGSQGEGIWVCKVKEGQEGEVTGSTILDLQEAVDNHKEEKTVDEFMTFCEQYIVGENGQLIDQRFLPRIVEGELRVNMIYDKPTEIVHKKPADGGISATLKSGAKYVSYKPDDPQFKKLMDDFVNKDLPQIMPSLGMEGMPIPLIWTSDFILGDKVDGEDTYFVGEFNCSCVGITQQMHLVDEVSDAVIKIVEMTKNKPAEPAAAPAPAAALPTLLPQPTSPTGKIVLIECEGGSDKKADGHRGDTIPISNALIEKNWECIPVYYSDAKYDEVKALLEKCDGFITRINPGTYPGVTQSKVDDLLREIAAMGKAPMQHPDVMQKMGAKDALVKIANLSCGMADTYAYYDIPTFKENFPKSIATGVRVVKQNRGSQGEGIWVCKVKEGQEGEVTGSTILDLQEAVDNHKEEKTVDEFMTFCEQYIVGENGQLIDQRFLPRIVEGELRVNMIYDKPTEIVHKKPADGGISATLKSGAKYVSYKPDDPQFKKLMDDFINKDLPQIMPSLGMEGMPIPLIWTSDFILGDKVDGEDTYFVGEFNCSCVGITQQMHLVDEVSDAVIKIVEMTKNKPAEPAAAPAPAAALPTLLPQPESPAGKIVLIECEGGSDKKADGHRGDTIPISNALIEKNWECIPVYYSDAKYDEVKALLEKCDGFITRINPGTYPGVTQSKVDDLLREIAAMGKAPMQHPDVMQKMGAKDALVKIANLSCGMADTYAYYDIPTFKENFPKSIATGVRVVKQNRGSQGEGIWVCKVKEGQEGEVTGSTILDLQEAVDNHKEEKTVDEFMTFCEQYIVGENGQLIDQRFLPRIVEGELRVNMIYDKPTEIVHKKPADGGISATLKSGAKYVSYKPDDPQFKKLMDDFVNKDLPQIMPSLGMEGMPIPLIWTSDFILGDKVDGEDTYFVGEFNCSCVGITQQMHLVDEVSDAVIKIVEMTKAKAE